MFDPTTDKPGILTGIAEFLLGTIFFPLVCYICQRFFRTTSVGLHLCEEYNIKSNGIHDISNKITSSTFALLACSTGVFVNQQCNSDILNERFYILDNYLIFGVSYFLYDVASMYMVYSTLEKEEVTVSAKEIFKFLSERPLIIFHHIFVPLVGFPAMMYFRGGYGDCLLGTSFLIESSTPFVSLRVILVHLQQKESLLYVVNGILMLVSFFLCRVMLFPILYWWYSSVSGLSLITAILTVPMWVHLSVIGLWTPQLMWFNRMLKGSIKIIKDRQKRIENGKKPPVKLISEDSPEEDSGEEDSAKKLCQKLD
eukprot:GFUD01020092.1.p1 GENE.GFUD01020092.1~~GFUD01020092.1.p1  ORF type:complete len:312 (-),score=45.39 GFUD01020092.1:162-1097(-)